MKMDDAIVEFGFDCKVRKLSTKTVANYQKQLRYIGKYLKDRQCDKQSGEGCQIHSGGAISPSRRLKGEYSL